MSDITLLSIGIILTNVGVLWHILFGHQR